MAFTGLNGTMVGIRGERNGVVVLQSGTRQSFQIGRIQSSIVADFTDIKEYRGYPTAATETGLYTIRTDDEPIVYRKSLGTDPVVKGIVPYSFDGKTMCILGFGNGEILSSSDGCNFGKFISVGTEIRDVYPRNSSEFYAATQNGIVRTIYEYDLQNNTHNLTLQEIKELVDDNYPEFQGMANDTVSAHVADSHSTGSEINEINESAMNVEMSNSMLSSWNHTEGDQDTIQIMSQNDIVY